MRIFNLISAVLVSFVFVPVSAGIPVAVNTAEELRSVRFGFPLLDHGTEFFWGNFCLSVILSVIAIFVLLEVIRLTASRQKPS